MARQKAQATSSGSNIGQAENQSLPVKTDAECPSSPTSPHRVLALGAERKRVKKHLSFAKMALVLSAGAASAQDVPRPAIEACLAHANAYANVAPGTAMFTGNSEADVARHGPGAGSYLRLQVDVPGGIPLSCTVRPDGRRVSLAP